MLSYRHAYHAGNHADVLKHVIVVAMARYMIQKEAPLWYVDTHAGAGSYDLDSEHARKLGEFRDGIGRLWERHDLPPAVADYVALVGALNGGQALKRYPGSPWFASQILRPDDRLRLFELHVTDGKSLGKLFHTAGRRITVTASDGLAGLKALLPPPTRRALVLVDPSYEIKTDYATTAKGLEEALKRFATGTYAIWYPQLARIEARQFPEKLKNLRQGEWLHATLTVSKPARDGFGMHGSGMFIINPPWTLATTLQETLPWLAKVLAQDAGAGFSLETSAG